MFTKNLNWENVKAGEKVTIEIKTEKAMVRDPGKLATLGHVPMDISRYVYFFLEEETGKWRILFSPHNRPSQIPAGRLEIPLMLSFKSPWYFTHQKMKNVLVQLYFWNFETENDDETEVQGKEVTEIIIKEDEDSEVVKPKKKRKPPQINDSYDEDSKEDYS